MKSKDSENGQNNSILRWIAAVAIALLVSYLRANGYLPESPQEAPQEEQIAAENTQETTAAEDQTSAENTQETATAVDQTAADNTQEVSHEEQTAAETEQEQSSALIRDSFCRTTYEVFVYSFCDSDGDGIGDLPGLLSRLDYINDGDP